MLFRVERHRAQGALLPIKGNRAWGAIPGIYYGCCAARGSLVGESFRSWARLIRY